MTWELLYKVGEEIIFLKYIFKYIFPTQIIKHVDVSNVHHSFSRYKRNIEM